MKFSVYQNSRIGPRASNQDRLAYSYSKDAILLVVADGMGGHANGEVAAEMTVQVLTNAFNQTATPTLNNPAKFLTENILQAHHAIDQYAHTNELLEAPKTTVVAAIVQFGQLYCAHVGDSRLYHYRDDHLLFRTEDHSMVQSLYNKGMIALDEMKSHPYRHKVYSCLGGYEPPEVTLANRQTLQAGDSVLLCTDGVWGALPDDAIKQALSGTVLSHNITKLLDQAEHSSLEEGDNMTAIGLQWGEKTHGQTTKTTQSVTNTSLEQQAAPVENHVAPAANTLKSHTNPLLMRDETDEVIEQTIAEIQHALIRTNRI